MSTVKAERVRKPKAKEGALVCKETPVSYRVKKPKVEKREFRFDGPSIVAFIESKCKTRRSTLAFLRSIGLTYNKKGEPIVVPK